jgi:hypothetical protein
MNNLLFLAKTNIKTEAKQDIAKSNNSNINNKSKNARKARVLDLFPKTQLDSIVEK